MYQHHVDLLIKGAVPLSNYYYIIFITLITKKISYVVSIALKRYKLIYPDNQKLPCRIKNYFKNKSLDKG